MEIDDQEIQSRLARFAQICHEAAVRLTPQRVEIFREVARTADHPDAERVLAGVRERMPTVSLDTVYRTLWLLHDLGLVHTLGGGRNRTRFDANLTRHHHFVCVRCGLTRDFHCQKLDGLALPETVSVFGRVEATHVEARGVCRECSDRKPKPRQPGKKEAK